MAKAKGPVTGRTIIDVAHPGQSAPAGNSKSVIVSNRPLLKDPMMVDKATTPDDDSLAKVSNKSSAEPSTAPLLEPVKIEKTAEKPASVDDSLSDEPAASEPVEPPKSVKPPIDESEDKAPKETAEEVADTPEPKTEKPDQSDQPVPPKPSEPEAKPADTKTDDKPDESSSASKDKDKPEIPVDTSDKEAEHQAVIDKLADSKKYYLPINTVEKRRSRRFVVLGIVLSLLLALAWADIALDAGLIHINNVKPLTHFFSN